MYVYSIMSILQRSLRPSCITRSLLFAAPASERRRVATASRARRLVLPRVGVELVSCEVRTPGVEQLARRVKPLASLGPIREPPVSDWSTRRPDIMGVWCWLAPELTNKPEAVDTEDAQFAGNSRVQLETRLGLTQGAS